MNICNKQFNDHKFLHLNHKFTLNIMIWHNKCARNISLKFFILFLFYLYPPDLQENNGGANM